MARLLSTGGIWIWLNAAWLLTGLVYFGWHPETIVFVYIFETLIIGLVCILKMLIHCFWGTRNETEAKLAVSKNFSDDELSTLSRMRMDGVVYQLYNVFVVAMFAVVFLGFVWGQSIFTFLMASNTHPGLFAGPDRALYNLVSLFSQTEIQAAFAGIALMHLVLLLQQFILPGEYHRTTLHQLFVQPWVRILIQQVVIMAGGFIFFKTGEGFVGIAVLLVVVKSVVDSTIVRHREKKAAREVLDIQQGLTA